MATRIAWRVSLRFDNAAAHAISPHVADDGLADKTSGQLSRTHWQAGP
jgi:hypothetical protein